MNSSTRTPGPAVERLAIWTYNQTRTGATEKGRNWVQLPDRKKEEYREKARRLLGELGLEEPRAMEQQVEKVDNAQQLETPTITLPYEVAVRFLNHGDTFEDRTALKGQLLAATDQETGEPDNSGVGKAVEVDRLVEIAMDAATGGVKEGEEVGDEIDFEAAVKAVLAAIQPFLTQPVRRDLCGGTEAIEVGDVDVPCEGCAGCQPVPGDGNSSSEEGEKRVVFQYHPECLEGENVREFHPEIVGAATGALRTLLHPETDARAHRDADILASCAVSEALKALVAVASLEGGDDA